MKHEIYHENWWNMKYIMKIDETWNVLGSIHKLRLHLGVGRWSEKCKIYYTKSANYGGTHVVKCQKMQM